MSDSITKAAAASLYRAASEQITNNIASSVSVVARSAFCITQRQYSPVTSMTSLTSTKTMSNLALRTKAAGKTVFVSLMNVSSASNKTNATHAIPDATSNPSHLKTSRDSLTVLSDLLLYYFIPIIIGSLLFLAIIYTLNGAKRRRTDLEMRGQTRQQDSGTLGALVRLEHRQRNWVGGLNASQTVLGQPQRVRQTAPIAIRATDMIGTAGRSQTSSQERFIGNTVIEEYGVGSERPDKELRLPPPAVTARSESTYMSTDTGCRTPPPRYNP